MKRLQKMIPLLLAMMIAVPAACQIAFADTQSNAKVQEHMKYTIDGKSIQVEVDADLISKLPKKDIDSVVKENKGKDKDLRIVSEDNLKKKDLEDSEKSVLYVFSSSKLTRVQVDADSVDGISVSQVKEMIDENEGSFVHVYDEGSGEPTFFERYKVMIIGGAGLVVLILLIAAGKHMKNKK